MHKPLSTGTLTTDSNTLIVPRAPSSKERLLRSVICNLESAAEDLATHQSHLNSGDTFGNGALFLIDAINEVNLASENMETVEAYIVDLRRYAAFWRSLAQKLIKQYEPTRPVLFTDIVEI